MFGSGAGRAWTLIGRHEKDQWDVCQQPDVVVKQELQELQQQPWDGYEHGGDLLQQRGAYEHGGDLQQQWDTLQRDAVLQQELKQWEQQQWDAFEHSLMVQQQWGAYERRADVQQVLWEQQKSDAFERSMVVRQEVELHFPSESARLQGMFEDVGDEFMLPNATVPQMQPLDFTLYERPPDATVTMTSMPPTPSPSAPLDISCSPPSDPLAIWLGNEPMGFKYGGDEVYPCGICGRAYGSLRSLQNHERKGHYTCDLCGKQLLSRRTLADHRFLHTGERPHRCPVCPMAFKRVRDLQRHIKERHQSAHLSVTVVDSSLPLTPPSPSPPTPSPSSSPLLPTILPVPLESPPSCSSTPEPILIRLCRSAEFPEQWKVVEI